MEQLLRDDARILSPPTSFSSGVRTRARAGGGAAKPVPTPSRSMLTTGWARAYAIVKRQGTVEGLRAVYEDGDGVELRTVQAGRPAPTTTRRP